MEDGLRLFLEGIKSDIAALKKSEEETRKSNEAIKILMMEEVFPMKQRLLHFEDEIEKVKAGINGISVKMQEYHDMKMQAKGISGLLRLLWNVGILAIIWNGIRIFLKNRFNIEW